MTPLATNEVTPCNACGTWICRDCGARRGYASRFSSAPHRCAKCSSASGHMVENTHRQGRAGDHEASYQKAVADGLHVRYPLVASP